MTSLVIEHFDRPDSSRDQHPLAAAGERAGDVLAGHAVWCAMALPAASRSVQQLRSRLDGAGPGVAAASLQVTVGDQLHRLAERVEKMLVGGSGISSESGLGPAEHEL